MPLDRGIIHNLDYLTYYLRKAWNRDGMLGFSDKCHLPNVVSGSLIQSNSHFLVFKKINEYICTRVKVVCKMHFVCSCWDGKKNTIVPSKRCKWLGCPFPKCKMKPVLVKWSSLETGSTLSHWPLAPIRLPLYPPSQNTQKLFIQPKNSSQMSCYLSV